MTVSSTIIKTAPYACDGVTTQFSFSFRVWESSEVKVVLRTVADGTETVLTETTHYTVTLSSDVPSAGYITTVGTYSAAYEIVVKANFPYTQEVDYGEGDTFPASSHEEALDRAVRLCQQLTEKLDRAVLFPEASIYSGITLPEPEASLALGWNVSEDALVNLASLPDAIDAWRDVLSSNRTYYVRTDGSNANTGLVNNAAGAWLTLQHALDVIGGDLDLAGYTVEVQCTGKFTEALIVPAIVGYNGSGYDQVNFKPAAANGATLDAAAGIGLFSAINSTPIQFEGFWFISQDATTGVCVESDAGGVISLKDPIWGVGGTHKLSVHSSARIITVAGTSTIRGNCTTHDYASSGGVIYNQPSLTETIISGVTISNAYAYAVDQGEIHYSNLAWVGTFTGRKYEIRQSGFIGHTGGLHLIPGSISGLDTRAPLRLMMQPIRNSRFDIWQNGNSASAVATGIAYTASGWGLYRNGLALGGSVLRATADTTGQPYALRLERDTGNASTAAIFLVQTFSTQDSLYWAGRKVLLNIRMKKGAGFSPTAVCAAILYTGTGSDEAFLAGFTGVATPSIIDLLPSTTTMNTYYGVPTTLSTAITQLAVAINFTPVGVAGADDSITIESIWLSEGDIPVENAPIPHELELDRMEHYEQVWGGDDADEYFATGAIIAGGATARFLLPYKRPMRGIPTLTTSGNIQGYFPRTGGVADISNLAILDASKSRSALSATLAGTAGDYTLLKAKADTTARITLRAELG